jgi:hypothetical protein
MGNLEKWGENMNKELLKKSKIIAIAILFIGASFLPQVGALDQTKIQENNNETTNQVTADTEYWALLVAVAVYADDPQQNRPLMLEEVDDFYDLLLESPWWSEDHIKVIKGEEATTTGIIQGLRMVFHWMLIFHLQMKKMVLMKH